MTKDYIDPPRPAPAPIYDGGPAFPYRVERGNAGGGGAVCRDYSGMSLRDYFAGQVLAGMMANGASGLAAAITDGTGTGRLAIENTARIAYMVADEMLRVRKL